MKLVACYKLVPEEQDINVNPDRTLSFAKAEWKIGQYDLNAVECAAALRGAGDETIALYAGGELAHNSKMKKNVLSRGIDSLISVSDPLLPGADAYATAVVLAAAIQKMGGADIVFCGEGSGDLYARQVGPMLGQILGYTNLNAVSKITPDGEKCVVERSLENETEVLEISLPAVLSVTTDINLPRIPGMKEILAAGKKPATVWTLADIAAAVEKRAEDVSTLAPPESERKQIVLEGTDDDTIGAFAEHVRKTV